MKLVLEISENRSLFFLELIKSLDYIKVLKEINENDNLSLLNELSESYGDVKAHISGDKDLKTAEDLYNEL